MGIEQREIQRADCRLQKSEVRRQRSGVKLISDLRLLTSVIDDFYAFYDFYGFYDLPLTAYRLEEMRNDAGLGINVALII